MIAETMNAVLTHGPGDMRYERIATPVPGAREVLIKVSRVGMGINDPTIAEGHWPMRTDRPTVAGHEFTGVVVALGEGAVEHHGLAIGDRVLAEQVAFCRRCFYCKRGWYHLCETPGLFGLNVDGGWADYMLFPENSIVHRLPPEVTDSAAIALESTSCGIYTVERGELRMGEAVCVLGGGFLGLIMVQVCRIMGAGLVVYCEDDDHRLGIGRSLGADAIFNLRRDDVVAEVRKLTGGLGCDLVVDHGQTEAIELGSRMLRKRGRFVVGAAYANSQSPKIEFGAICNQNELTFIGRTMSGGMDASCFKRAIEYVRRGAIRLEPVVTHNLPLKDFQRALDISRRRLEHAIKVSMTP